MDSYGRRIIGGFAAMVALFGLLTARLAVLSSTDSLAAAQQTQSTYLLDVADTRGVIYDRALRRLTDRQGSYVAAVLPNERAADVLLREVDEAERAAVHRRLEQMTPFTCPVGTKELYARGLEVFWVPQRYADDQIALHMLGQTDASTGKGASGLEKAYDKLLSGAGGTLKVRYAADALRRAIADTPPEILDSGYQTGAGLVLTLDCDIQLLVEEAARPIERGAVVVMDPYTGDIRASVSRPAYNPNDRAASLEDPGAPFINRALYAYPVGSTFKLLTAAAALEKGIPTSRTFYCDGSITVGDQVFRCQNRNGHGEIDMYEATARSCNPYFISLALEVGGPTLRYKAEQLGFASSCELAPGLRAMPGTLPDARELLAPAATANLGFGQGVLTATPLQIASLVSAMVNGGGAVVPRLVEGTTTDGLTFASHTAVYSPTAVFLPEAARTVGRLMVGVVEGGSGQKARPDRGGAGGKTASAQTGQYQDGEEVVHAWFSGFYPAQDPRYVIVVLVEGGDSGSEVACPIFREIADGIAALEGIPPDPELPQDGDAA